MSPTPLSHPARPLAPTADTPPPLRLLQRWTPAAPERPAPVPRGLWQRLRAALRRGLSAP